MVNENNEWISRGDGNKRYYFERANLWVTQANETERNISNTLILIGTIFLGISSPLVSDLKSLNESYKIALFVSWVFSIFSIICGLAQFYTNLKFFEKIAKGDNDNEGLWSEVTYTQTDYDRIRAKSDEINRNIVLTTPYKALKLQAVGLMIAIILAVLVGAGNFLFSSNQINSKSKHLPVKNHLNIFENPAKGNRRFVY